MNEDGVLEVAIDDVELHRLNALLNEIFGLDNHVANIAIMHNPKGREQAHFSDAHEYTLIYAKDKEKLSLQRLPLSDTDIKSKYPKQDGTLRYRELPLRRRGNAPFREDRPYMYFPFVYDRRNQLISIIAVDEYKKIYDGTRFDDKYVESLTSEYSEKGLSLIFPIREDSSLGRWRWGFDRCAKEVVNGIFFIRSKNNPTIYHKDYANNTILPKSIWFDVRYDASTKGTNILKNIIANNLFDYPKSIFTVEDLLHIGSDTNSVILDFFAGSGTTGHSIANLSRRDTKKRKYILVEMGAHFDTVLKPRMAKVVYSDGWKNGKPINRHTGISHCFKYLRLESYEDSLNNLRFDDNQERDETLTESKELREDYTLRYMLDVETRGSQSLLNLKAFSDPLRYTLKVKKPGSDELEERRVDLIETFNYLIGLRTSHIGEPQTFSANFKRDPDPELPEDQQTRLILDGVLKKDPRGAWTFRKAEGLLPKNPAKPDNGLTAKTLIIWRNLTGNQEEDNLMLDEWLKLENIDSSSFNIVYVNGSSNLPDSQKDGKAAWNVRLIEEEFMKRMWKTEDM